MTAASRTAGSAPHAQSGPAGRTPEETHGEVTPLELFFDLVFVFAVSRLSHHLLEHVTWRGVAETLVLLLAVFAVWYYTTWTAVLVPVDRPGPRAMVLTVMVPGLFMNASVTRAFDATGWSFVGPLLLIQLGRTAWTIRNAPNATFREHFVRTLLWLVATAPLWIIGAAASPEPRLAWWALAAGLDLVGTWLAHPVPGRRLQSAHIAFPGGHLLERCRLFLIVALGETILTTGTAVASAPTTLMTAVTGTAAMVGVMALWLLGFGRAGHLAVREVEATSDPVRAARHAADALLVMVAGLIAVAVANEMVIAHPHGHTTTALSLLLFGGPVLFLLAQAWYLGLLASDAPRLRLAGSAALVVIAAAALLAPPYVTMLLAGASLATLAVLDQR